MDTNNYNLLYWSKRVPPIPLSFTLREVAHILKSQQIHYYIDTLKFDPKDTELLKRLNEEEKEWLAKNSSSIRNLIDELQLKNGIDNSSRFLKIDLHPDTIMNYQILQKWIAIKIPTEESRPTIHLVVKSNPGQEASIKFGILGV